MANFNRIITASNGDTVMATEDIAAEVEDINLQRVDEVQVALRPEEIDEFYVEREFDHRADEQPELWAAKSEARSRSRKVEAAGLKDQADDVNFLVSGQRNVVDASREFFVFARNVLRPYTRRPKYEKARYYITTGLIGAGDIAGIAGAAIMLGEIVYLAVMQAVASGVAAITSGAIGYELKDARRARRREKPTKELTTDERAFAHLFRGADDGEFIVKIMVFGSLGIGALIAGSVFALRSTTEGTTAGFVFGCLAAAISLATFTNSYVYADEVADLIETAESDYRRDVKKLQKLSQAEARTGYERASAEAASVEAEGVRSGAAASKRVKGFGLEVLRNNPGIAGHGWAAGCGISSTEPSSKVVHRLPGVSTGMIYQVPADQPFAGGANRDGQPRKR